MSIKWPAILKDGRCRRVGQLMQGKCVLLFSEKKIAKVLLQRKLCWLCKLPCHLGYKVFAAVLAPMRNFKMGSF